VTQAGSRSGRIATNLGPACLIAVVAILAMIGHGDFSAPPRYDGAGYAVLARSLAEGSGYCAIDHPDQPRHAHFPPGYPALLALVRIAAGASAFAAHLASCLCTVGATLAAWCWFRRIYRRDVALMLGLALAINWIWVRTGTAIQSEPLYELLGQLTIVVAMVTASARRIGLAALLGVLMAACLLTRHVAIGLVLAVLLDLLLRRRWAMALTAAVVAALLICPWIAWIAVLGSGQRTQAMLLVEGNSDLPARVMAQAVFYVQRIPDQITGPLVEVATIIHRSPAVEIAANLWASLGTGVILMGWIHALRRPRRRLAGLIPLLTLGLLLAWPYTEAGRFLIPLIPCLLIGAVEGLTCLCRSVLRRFGPGIPRWRLAHGAAVLVLIASLPYSSYSIITGRSRARDAANRDFDAACAWIAHDGDRPGPVLTRHPGEVFLATGRHALEVSTSERPGEADAPSEEIARTIARYRVAYLVIDEDRYGGAPRGPLARFVAERPGRVRKAWSQEHGRSGVFVYEVLPES
jgi:hypothetical protein